MLGVGNRVKEQKTGLVCWKLGLVFVFAMAQIIMVIIANPAQCAGDAVSYIALAKHAAAAGHLYPTAADLYSDYLFAPGYVNYLAAYFALGFSEKAPLFLNIVFNLLLLFAIYDLGKKAFGQCVGEGAALLFMLSVTTYASTLNLLTEQTFTSLAGLSLCLAATGRRKALFLSGLLLGLANWIRPLSVVFLLGIVLMALLHLITWKRLKELALGFVLMALFIGSLTYAASDVFAFQSSTAGVNLRMSANDYAKGNTSSGIRIFARGEASDLSQSGLTFRERDLYWRKQALSWIGENPGRYFGMMPIKFARLWGVDVGFLDAFSGKDGIIQSPAYMKQLARDFPRLNFLQGVVLYNNLLYLMTFLLAVYGGTICWRKKNRLGIVLLALWCMGTLATLPFPCNSRYHFPYMMSVYIFAFASVALHHLWSRYQQRRRQEDRME